MRILLFGSSGYIGSEFVRQLSTSSGFEFKTSKSRTFSGIHDDIYEYSPNAVINCAAFITKPSVDLCEDHKSETLLGNTVLPSLISAACRQQMVIMLQVSTGCLFNGDKGGTGWTEEDAPQLTFDTGAGYYVGTKELAERVVRKHHNHYICRTRLPFDSLDHPRNYLTKLMGFSKICDETNSLSHRGDFVSACLQLLMNQAPYGTYNCTNEGGVSARWVCDQIRAYIPGFNKEFEFWGKKEFAETVAKTPKSNCILSVKKLQDAGVTMRHVSAAVLDSLKNWKHV